MRIDSRISTYEHIQEVRKNINRFISELLRRAMHHDSSKLESPEKEAFDEVIPKLLGVSYGSEEYKEALKGMNQIMLHHYAKNRHHPEHFCEGVNGMNLVDLIEMFCDWQAACKRHADGDLNRSIDINNERHELGEVLTQIFKNTARSFSA